MMRPQVAPRAMWRRANSLINRAGAMASTVNCWCQVAERDRPEWAAEPVAVAGAKVSCTQPVALLTRMSTGPRCCSAASNSRPDSRVRQVGLDGHGLAAVGLELVNDRRSVLHTLVAVALQNAGINLVIDVQERAQHRAASLTQRHGRRRADAVIGSGHDRRMPARPTCHRGATSYGQQHAPSRPAGFDGHHLIHHDVTGESAQP